MRDQETRKSRSALVSDWLLRAIVAVGAFVLSGRGMALGALLGCVLLSVGPWLRPAVSCDFRGTHIPWVDSEDGGFLPQFVAEAPRNHFYMSVGAPLALIAIAGLGVVMLLPQRTATVFGLLLMLSLPATAAALWNHPALIEFFDSEVRGRTILRAVFRNESRDLLIGESPDRLAKRWGDRTTIELLSDEHPLLRPFRYSLYGPWLVTVSALGVVLATTRGWPRGVAHAAGWAGVGVVLAAAVTLPRLRAEYHFAQAAEHESANRFEAAEASLERARSAMPPMQFTRRYWLDRGRLAHRQKRDNRFARVFAAHQFAVAKRYTEARSVLGDNESALAVERELLSEIIANTAGIYASQHNFAASELLWSEAADLTPWTPIYWLGGAATALWDDPARAPEVEERVFPRFDQVGDRVLRSDIASLVGDAYFQTGAFAEAREMYARSLNNFNLPKHVNLRAQYGRLGM